MEATKFCSNKDCKQQNPQPLTNFHVDKRKKDGFRSRCKACELARAETYRKANREVLAEKQRQYYNENGDVQREASRNWKAKNKTRQREYWIKWYEDHKEDRAQYSHDYGQENHDGVLERSRKRRAKSFNAPGTFTEAEFRDKLKEFGFRCFWCGKLLSEDDITRDHYIPLVKGGSNTIENIVPSCKSCNFKKRNKMPSEFKAMQTGNPDPSREGHKVSRKEQRLDGESQQ